MAHTRQDAQRVGKSAAARIRACPASARRSLSISALPNAWHPGAEPRSASALGTNDRLVFVVGSPRSGTTFLAGAVGSLPGFVDLGEVAPLKAAVPTLAALDPEEAARRLRRTLSVARRAGLVGSIRPVEQTPEVAHLLRAVPIAYPEARIVHMIRDGRDVVCSLLEKRWLRSQQSAADDAGVAYGSYARFWVEPDRREEFERASDARGSVGLAPLPDRSSLLRGFDHTRSATSGWPRALGTWRRSSLRTSRRPSEISPRRSGASHAESVGRWRRDLDEPQLADVMDGAGTSSRSSAT